MGYKSHAKRELEKINANKFIKKCIYELLDEFSKQGHSGGSAPYGMNVFKRMSKLKNLDEVEKEFIKIGYNPIEKSEDEPDKWIQEGTYKLLDIFYKQNHTEETSNLVLEYFYKLSMFKPLMPIMCTDDEWNNISESMGGENMYQNNRCSAVFKNNDEKPYYLDAIVWKNQNGSTYTGSVFNSKNEKITSSQIIKIPFIPKTFYVNVIDYEIAKDDWESYIEDETQLKEVWKYYEHQETPSYLRIKKLKTINDL